MDPPRSSERKLPLHLSFNNRYNIRKPTYPLRLKQISILVTLITSAVSHMLRIPSLASSADDHNGSLKFGSYETSTPASLAALAAAMCAVLQGSAIRLIEP